MSWYAQRVAWRAAGVVKNRVVLPLNLPIAFREPGFDACCRAIQALCPGRGRDELHELYLEFLQQTDLFGELDHRMVEARGRHAQLVGWHTFAYMLIRIEQPETMIETGVFDGRSTAVLLQAMENNGTGRLISIDLPANEEIFDSTHRMVDTVLPPGKLPGWLVPDRLRHRHELLLGPSSEHLGPALAGVDTLDVFMHDSLHTYDNQWMEYSAAWPKIREGGLLLSDDLYDNDAFYDWAKRHGRSWVHVGAFGALRK